MFCLSSANHKSTVCEPPPPASVPRLLQNLVGSLSRQFLQMIELPAIGAEPEGRRAEIDDQVMDFRFRDHRRENVPSVPSGPGVETENLSAPSAHDAVDPRGVFRRHRNLDLVDRLKQNGITFRHAFAHGKAGGGAEGVFGTVDRMELAIDKRDGDIDNRKAKRPFGEIFANAMLDGGNILARHGAADDPLLEIEARATRQRPDFDMDIAELPMPAALSPVAGALRRHLSDGLFLGNFRAPGFDLEAILVTHPVDGNVEVNFALSPQQQFLRLLAMLDLE